MLTLLCNDISLFIVQSWTSIQSPYAQSTNTTFQTGLDKNTRKKVNWFEG